MKKLAFPVYVISHSPSVLAFCSSFFFLDLPFADAFRNMCWTSVAAIIVMSIAIVIAVKFLRSWLSDIGHSLYSLAAAGLFLLNMFKVALVFSFLGAIIVFAASFFFFDFSFIHVVRNSMLSFVLPLAIPLGVTLLSTAIILIFNGCSWLWFKITHR